MNALSIATWVAVGLAWVISVYALATISRAKKIMDVKRRETEYSVQTPVRGRDGMDGISVRRTYCPDDATHKRWVGPWRGIDE